MMLSTRLGKKEKTVHDELVGRLFSVFSGLQTWCEKVSVQRKREARQCRGKDNERGHWGRRAGCFAPLKLGPRVPLSQVVVPAHPNQQFTLGLPFSTKAHLLLPIVHTQNIISHTHKSVHASTVSCVLLKGVLEIHSRFCLTYMHFGVMHLTQTQIHYSTDYMQNDSSSLLTSDYLQREG